MKKIFAILSIVAVAMCACKSGNEKYLNGKWETITVNKGQVSIETPFEMSAKDVSKELASVQQYLKSMEMKTSPESNNNFLVLVSGIEYVDEIKPDYRGAAENAIKSMEKEGKMKDIKFETSDITLGEKPGVQQSGSFTYRSKPYLFKHSVYGYDNKLVELLVACPEKDNAGSEIMARVLKSLVIK